MSTKEKKWPGISVTTTDHEIITRIRSSDGILKSIPAKDLLMIAAALAVSKKAPVLNLKSEPSSRDIVNPALMQKSEYNEYRQYIGLIFYLTNGNKKLENMKDVSVMVKNFIEYAQRGLKLLETTYLDSKDGTNNLIDDFSALLIN
jgi:hypothetical protein